MLSFWLSPQVTNLQITIELKLKSRMLLHNPKHAPTRIRLKSAFSFGGSVFDDDDDEDVPEPPPDVPADCDGILEA